MTSIAARVAAGTWQDVRYAARVLLKDRGFTATAVATLAVCIAVNTLLFAVVYGVVLRPLPFDNADRLVYLYNAYPNAGAPRASTGVPDYFDRRAAMPALDESAIYRRQGVTLTGVDGAERLIALRTTPSLARVINAQPAQGRLFTDADGEVGQDRVAVISQSYWTQQLGGDPGVIGRQVRININGEPHEIVGVLPQGFTFIWNDIDLWLPAAFTPEQRGDDARHSNNWQMIGRLAPGATLEQAQAQLDAINVRNHERFPALRQILDDAGFASFVAMLQDELVRDVKPMLLLLWGGVLLVLLLGCVNIATLVLVRSSRRARELATRQAIGAGLWRLRRQTMTEALLLSTLGGLAGLALGTWALRAAAPALHLDELPRGFDVGVGAVSVGVVMALSVVVGVVLGLIPTAGASRLDATRALRDDSRSGTAGRRTVFVRKALATAQMALAFILLVGAGLLFSSFREILRVDTGFDPEGVMTAAVSLPPASYADDDALRTMTDRVLDGIRALPAVDSAGAVTVLPMSGDSSDSVIIPEGYDRPAGESLISPNVSIVSETYFDAMRIGLVSGRFFDSRDRAGSLPVAIIDERLASRFWPGRDPLGRRMYLPDSAEAALTPGPDTLYVTVVGVVRNVQLAPPGLGPEPVGAYYFPLRQQPSRAFVIAARTSADPGTLVAPMRGVLRDLDPELPLFGVDSMADRLDGALAARRAPMMLSVGFGAVALFLAAIGVYGVLAYGVAERRREIGIRMALGGTTIDVFRHVLGDGLRIVAAGLVLGAGGAYVAARAMASLLFEVQPTDPAVAGSVAAILTLVALVAIALPARRAAKVNPAAVLNS
jgi:predicted permease